MNQKSMGLEANLTCDVLLQNLLKDHKEGGFEVCNERRIGGTSKSYTQTKRLKEKVIELRL